MTLETWIAIASLVVALGGFATLLVRLGRWGQRLESRIDAVSASLENRIDVLSTRLEGRIDTLNARMEAFSAWAQGFSKEVNAFLGLIVTFLHRRGSLSDEELTLVLQRQSALGDVAVDSLFERERHARNPLTSEELERLQAYVDRARAGQWFTEEEVRDYNRLVSVLEREKPTDPGVWPLVALGAFLLGLVLGRGGQRTR